MFNFREFIKAGFLGAIGHQPDYWIILNAGGYANQGVLTMEDLAEIQTAIEAQYIVEEEPEVPDEEIFEEPVEDLVEETNEGIIEETEDGLGEEIPDAGATEAETAEDEVSVENTVIEETVAEG